MISNSFWDRGTFPRNAVNPFLGSCLKLFLAAYTCEKSILSFSIRLR